MGMKELKALALKRGLVSSADARRYGVPRSSFADFRRRYQCTKVLPGVYAVSGVKADRLRAIHAACLWAPGAVVSHRTALWLWGLASLPPSKIELTLDAARAPRCRGVTVHRTRRFENGERTIKDGIPVTSLMRTLLDAAKYLSEDVLAELLESAIRDGKVHVRALERRLAVAHHGWRGLDKLHRVLGEHLSRDAVLDSPLEVRLWRMLKKAKFPLPISQAPFEDERGQPGRVDFIYPDQGLVLECVGAAFHGSDMFEKDTRRRTRLAVLGYRVIEVTKQMLDEKVVLLQQIRTALDVRPPIRDPVVESYLRGEREAAQVERRANREQKRERAPKP